jgi:putative ABC transport system permease protein
MKVGQKFVGSHGLASNEEDAEHDQHPFTAVGVMTPTGTVADRLILVSVESVWDVHGIEHGDEHHAEEHGHDNHADESALKPEVTALLVKYRSSYGALQIPALVNRQTEMQAAVPAIETARLLSLLGAGIDGARLFAWLLALTGGLSIFVALLNAASARQGDLALLRVMGATRRAVFGTILTEGLLTAAGGIALGLILGHGTLALAVSSFSQLGDIGINPFAFQLGEAVIILGVFVIGLLAAFIPAWRVFRTDLAATLARTG